MTAKAPIIEVAIRSGASAVSPRYVSSVLTVGGRRPRPSTDQTLAQRCEHGVGDVRRPKEQGHLRHPVLRHRKKDGGLDLALERAHERRSHHPYNLGALTHGVDDGATDGIAAKEQIRGLFIENSDAACRAVRTPGVSWPAISVAPMASRNASDTTRVSRLTDGRSVVTAARNRARAPAAAAPLREPDRRFAARTSEVSAVARSRTTPMISTSRPAGSSTVRPTGFASNNRARRLFVGNGNEAPAVREAEQASLARRQAQLRQHVVGQHSRVERHGSPLEARGLNAIRPPRRSRSWKRRSP